MSSQTADSWVSRTLLPADCSPVLWYNKINFSGDVKPYMTKLLLPFIFFSLFLVPLTTFGADIIGPETRLVNSEIVVKTGLLMDERSLNDLKSGISKEITFHIDLFRVWKVWPDEFIAGKTIIRTLRGDPVKKEFTATSFDGATLIEKRFKTFDSMLDWSLNIRDLKLGNARELEPSDYFVKITVVSRLRKLPPVIGYLLFFVPEDEFKVTKDSPGIAVRHEK
jgi:hypothetical protein